MLYAICYMLYAICYMLYAICYILYTIYFILYTIYYILHTIYYILYTIYYILYTIYYILYTMFYIIHNLLQNIQWRTNLRSTWATQSLLDKALGTQPKVVFMLGATLSEEHQMPVNYESEGSEDIIQADFIDSYFNNTYKVMYNFK